MPYMYMLECADGTYYTGSTQELKQRLAEHEAGVGANHTTHRLPIKLVYFEEFLRVEDAFNREKQIQKWGRAKKKALIDQNIEGLELKAKKDFKTYRT